MAKVSLSPLFKVELGVMTTLTPLIRNTCGDVGSPLEMTDSVVVPHEVIEVTNSVGLPQKMTESGGHVNAPDSVKGRLQEHISFWKEELQASSFVLCTIESGYVLANCPSSLSLHHCPVEINSRLSGMLSL